MNEKEPVCIVVGAGDYIGAARRDAWTHELDVRPFAVTTRRVEHWPT